MLRFEAFYDYKYICIYPNEALKRQVLLTKTQVAILINFCVGELVQPSLNSPVVVVVILLLHWLRQRAVTLASIVKLT